MKNVVAYLRVSTDGQVGEDKFGLEVQEESIKAYCKKNDLNIVKWFKDEGESGAKERPGFDEIIYGEVANPPYEAVVVAKSDRVARDINVYYYYKMMLSKKNLELISIAEDFGQFGAFKGIIEAFTMCVAEMERDNITKRTSGGRIRKALRGGYSGGRAPMGYKIEDGRLVVNEDEAPAVKFIFEEMDKGNTIMGTRDALNKAGFKTRSGKEFAISTVDSIRKNRKTYEGYYRYGENGDWVKGEHEAILK